MKRAVLPVLGMVMILVWTLGGQQFAGERAPAQVSLETGLIGWWKFDETSGTTAADSSPAGHAGTLERGASFVPGRIGNAVAFDGKAACVRIPGFKGVTGPKPRTVAAWIKTPKAAGEIVRWGSEKPGKLWQFGFIRGHVGVSPKGGYLYMQAALHDDAWHHVAVVVQEAAPPNLHDHVRLYVDGQRAEIHKIGLLDLWPIETGDNLDVMIGRGFKGLIDDLRIYQRALREEEILALFNTVPPPTPPKPTNP